MKLVVVELTKFKSLKQEANESSFYIGSEIPAATVNLKGFEK